MTINSFSEITDEDLIKLCRNGDKGAEEHLLKKYKGLVLAKSKSYYIIGGDSDDLIQEGMIGLFQAIRDYNGESGSNFKSFAVLCINRHMISAIRKANRIKNRALNESLSLDIENEEGLVESLIENNVNDPVVRMMMKETAEMLELNNTPIFSKFESEVWTYLRQGLGYKEIAGKMDRTPKSVDNAIQRIKKKVANYISR